ncbi:uncharacterized protein LOC114268404 [Camellia sinensis]|uniref:uncharacterized protein LOC114268404 n=1 Tax=Camellia sinensis TaxID=4442 RepID=UPI001036C044|nr:uncharacterized protein LOC114268404 [Camellia sinensis]
MAPLQPPSPALSPSPTQTLHHHFTHPNHPLIKIYTAAEYKCDGCTPLGIGTRRHCSAGCDFDLHEYWRRLSSTLSSPLHPNHHLSLLHHPGGSNGRFCDLCDHLVNGLFYTCQSCSFDAHLSAPNFLYTCDMRFTPNTCSLFSRTGLAIGVISADVDVPRGGTGVGPVTSTSTWIVLRGHRMLWQGGDWAGSDHLGPATATATLPATGYLNQHHNHHCGYWVSKSAGLRL